MKVLHLYSNWKWTGPAEPALNLIQALSANHEVAFVRGRPPKARIENQFDEPCAHRGIEPLEGFRLDKHTNVISNLFDGIKLRKLLIREKFDVIHVHLQNDHLLAGLACVALPKEPPIVRSFYGPMGPDANLRTRLLLRRMTSGAIVFSELGKSRLVGKLRYPERRSAVIPVGVDIKRFDPARFDKMRARIKHGLDRGDFVIGIVARMQRHRKFDILLEAMRLAMAEEPDLKLLIVGRGTHQEEVARKPVREMGLEDRVLFAGYQRGDDFVETLAAMDAAIFLVPGSDGSCRAIREKMAMGLPVIASDVPPLNEMIQTGNTGLLIEPNVEGIREACLMLARSLEETRRMGEEALEFTRRCYSLDEQAARVEQFYGRVLEEGVRPSRRIEGPRMV